MRATAQSEPRDSSGNITSRLLFGVLAGNVFATVCVAAFRPFPGNGFLEDSHLNLVLTTGTLSLVSSGLLFLVSGLRRGQRAWWTVLTAVNIVQVVRLVPALAAIAMWAQTGEIDGMLWGFVFVPFIGILAAVGLVVTMREMRRAKRRRLSQRAA